MIRSDKINIVVAIAVVFALIISIVLVGFGNAQTEGGAKTEPLYAVKVFGTDIISIEIFADEADWQEMLDNARSEQFIMADVIVNGTKFQKVGIRPKGNSSLTQVASSNSDRYSFRLQFDEYIKDQTCFGLESFVVNNMLGDNTYMKEYVSYDLMREAGVDAPYFGYADIKVNGEKWGLYLAVELYNDSYEQRVFGNTSGMLYNVKSMDMGGGQPGGQQGDGNFPAMPGWGNLPAMPGWGNFPAMPDWGNLPAMPEGWSFPAMPEGGDSPTMPDRKNSSSGIQGGGNAPAMPDWGNFPAMPGGGDSPAMPEGVRRPAMQDTQDGTSLPQSANPSQEGNNSNSRSRNFGGWGGMGRSGGSLEYIDDNTESYGSIFNNVVGKGSKSDYQRVVTALKVLSEGRELETYFDVDQILRYLAAHTVVVNLDSYSSSMAQNYYLYERDGQITILPWDYNLAWGGFQNGSASSVINFPIDTPVSGVDMSSRPLIEKLLSNTEYLERYHGYLQQLMDEYFANGKFEEKVKELDALISEYVKNDVTAFCTYDEYKTAVSTFTSLGNLRAQSVQAQLDGTVPSTSAEQSAYPSKRISAGDLKLSDLGSMMGGRGGNMGFPGWGQGGQFGGMQGGQFGQGNRFGGNMQENGEQNTPPGNTTPGDRASGNTASDNTYRQGRQAGNIPNRPGIGTSDRQGFAAGAANGQWFMGAPTGRQSGSGTLILYGVLVLVLLGAIIFAARYKKCY